MFKRVLKPQFKTALAIIWFAFTFSLVTWWWIFFLNRLKHEPSFRMFAWEGSILLAAVFIGGVALVWFTRRDQARHERLRFFFSTFSHDIKTSISRLRLQAEVMSENPQGQSNPILHRLLHDIQRLDLQLENSLLLANLEDGKLLRENISLKAVLTTLRNEFPDLAIELEKEASILGDRRALLSVFRNLLQNSVQHGKSSVVRLGVSRLDDHQLEITLQDDGIGYQGALRKLGSEILVSTDSRGNGIGLLITKRLLEKMNGDISFESKDSKGFRSLLRVEGRL